MAALRSALHPTLQEEEAFWWRVTPLRSSRPKARCVTEQSWRLRRQQCERFLAAAGGKLWIPVAACADGKSTVILEKMNRSDPANSWRARERRRSSTLTRPRA